MLPLVLKASPATRRKLCDQPSSKHLIVAKKAFDQTKALDCIDAAQPIVLMQHNELHNQAERKTRPASVSFTSRKREQHTVLYFILLLKTDFASHKPDPDKEEL